MTFKFQWKKVLVFEENWPFKAEEKRQRAFEKAQAKAFVLEKDGKIYTQIKIDEITNLGAVKIRLRSLFAASCDREDTKNEKQ